MKQLWLIGLMCLMPRFALAIEPPSAVSGSIPDAVIASARAHATLSLIVKTGDWMTTQALQGTGQTRYLRGLLVSAPLGGSAVFQPDSPVLVQPYCGASAPGGPATDCAKFTNRNLQIWTTLQDINPIRGKDGRVLIQVKNLTDAAFLP